MRIALGPFPTLSGSVELPAPTDVVNMIIQTKFKAGHPGSHWSGLPFPFIGKGREVEALGAVGYCRNEARSDAGKLLMSGKI
jgi:hypothetical protein